MDRRNEKRSRCADGPVPDQNRRTMIRVWRATPPEGNIVEDMTFGTMTAGTMTAGMRPQVERALRRERRGSRTGLAYDPARHLALVRMTRK
jgi:hypothetical protein